MHLVNASCLKCKILSKYQERQYITCAINKTYFHMYEWVIYEGDIPAYLRDLAFLPMLQLYHNIKIMHYTYLEVFRYLCNL